MCDYSLMHVASRPAKVGDKLETAGFSGTTSRGFKGSDDPSTAVCVLPGTEIAFDENIKVRGSYVFSIEATERQHKVARFRQINIDQPLTHHDALELPDGEVVMLHDLAEGQKATVLQLPAKPKTEEEAKAQKRIEVKA